MNRLIIAAAGSGKTTCLVKEALSVERGNVLITTFTEANEDEIRSKIIKKKKCIPNNIHVQTWFSFLLQHGVRPYQSIMEDILYDKRVGFYLSEGISGIKYINSRGKTFYWGEADTIKYYFTNDYKIYSDKISKFICKCNERTNNEVIKRMARIYPHIFIDEIQDLAGWDLEIIRLLFDSDSSVVMVGDPRQATYSTNESRKYRKYRNGKIKEFIENECKNGVCEIDTKTLNRSHRNCKEICVLASGLYPEYDECKPCECEECRRNVPILQGVYIVKKNDIMRYCDKFDKITHLRYRGAIYPDVNYGASKGRSYDRVVIHPTEKIEKYLKDGELKKIDTIKAKFYVALTRARYSVAIVCDYKDTEYIGGLVKYEKSNVE